MVSVVAPPGLQKTGSVVVVARASFLRSMWDVPRSWTEPLSPALAGRLSTTEAPGKQGSPRTVSLFYITSPINYCNTPFYQLQCLSHFLANFSGTLVTLISGIT